MTPVDIDKLKELLASQGWVPWPHRIVPPSAPAQELCIAAVNSLAALIAKAERVDALERVVRELLPMTDAAFHAEASRVLTGQAMRDPVNKARRRAEALLTELDAARNALSPKESEK